MHGLAATKMVMNSSAPLESVQRQLARHISLACAIATTASSSAGRACRSSALG